MKIVDRSGYKASPWVKYLTKNGEYQIRMNWFVKNIIKHYFFIIKKYLFFKLIMSFVSEYVSPFFQKYSDWLDGEYLSSKLRFKGGK